MDLRTIVKAEPSQIKITYNDKVMFIGSCFASSIGQRLADGKFRVLINPAGAVYNPVSVCNTLDLITSGVDFSKDDLYKYNGMFHSLFHYTDFSSEDPAKLLEKINNKSKEAFSFLANCNILFITFGTARVYRFKETGSIVSNCHKIPSQQFISELLSVEEVVLEWQKQLDRLHTLFPSLKVIFTVSPVRHWKDGAHGNQLSKSVLFIAIEELLKHPSSPAYFPAYEILMDDLRDYRFYDDDMIHPSVLAINYIWDVFSQCYLENKTINTYNEVKKITKAFQHRFITDSPSGIKVFAEKMLNNISDLENKFPQIDLSNERSYFSDLINQIGS